MSFKNKRDGKAIKSIGLREYLIYAIGKIVWVVVSVLIAL